MIKGKFFMELMKYLQSKDFTNLSFYVNRNQMVHTAL